jgi:DNA-binding PadR family transcriptional regulator
MCQQVVLAILKKKNKWMTARDIEAEINNISLGSIMTNLKKLKKYRLIETKKSKTTTKNDVKIPVTKYRATK